MSGFVWTIGDALAVIVWLGLIVLAGLAWLAGAIRGGVTRARRQRREGRE